MFKSEGLSERIFFGALIIFGYFSMVALSITAPVLVVAMLPEKQANLELPTINNAIGTVKDSLLVIGPLLGVIVNAIWKTDKADKQTADTVNTLATAVTTAMAMPAPPEPAPTAP